ncbi:MAG: DUF2073 domain-containing protein [Nanoarchaeota archaeon]|nr:DUF2073 domain-containing protein [Nanoarchaeota archaeon]
MDSTQRIKKILNIVLGNVILIIQGKLEANEETRLIGDTMAMIGHVKDFKGIELAVISNNGEDGLLGRFRRNIINVIGGSDIGALTIVGPATIVKEIKKNPKKIELLLDRG